LLIAFPGNVASFALAGDIDRDLSSFRFPGIVFKTVAAGRHTTGFSSS
jgi:hypothetical protein